MQATKRDQPIRGLELSLLQAKDYLRDQRRAGFITHWEIETSDTSKGMFSVRVSLSEPGGSLFASKVSAYHRGRDLLSCAHRAVAEVRR